ncbi:MAG TPA: PQQ-dependent dehydrogenase, methanol/ethanol family [Gammaproteobacteria bacterium]|jgi:alcohol dehydrogenase (cytochrome c)|nr:PQQ-dependent dehydrogenase, methanol/ethanol family [Pseudomonadales bacterium]MBT5720456.1 PQQ-dependent dehydrogenase, methanol/ethanol family [Gammaproteobacteria bacterium]MBT7226185.1 PQQ-dependent dehydrogenase, methanol/ethanol family [Gammaproteobacteria bacterium]MDB3908575.1 PQQ-dependent dehydrogenase, methanol/ethanol family [Gammaproteobacteria bacterium]HAS49142.1 PQQ-dependent dehydrogenase, methanol/ethanol family [Gammaproteobacteria bacterium]
MSKFSKSLLVLLGMGLFSSAATAQNVTTEILENAQDYSDRWVTYGKNYGAWRYMPDAQINRDTVANLRPVWIKQNGVTGGAYEVTALVNDGRMYLTTANSHLLVVDPLTGDELWRYDHDFENVDLCCGPHNRGVGLHEDKVFWGTLDAHLLAFDAATGIQLWDAEVGDHRESFSVTGAPLVVKDMVLIGVGGGEYGIRGYIDAYDVNTGERRWRFYTTPAEGEPGNETWLGDSWKTGGAPTWVTGTYDPETDMVFWGTGNPWPDINNAVRAGDNLYSNSVVALDADSGDLRWYFQTSPRDEFDHDSTSEPMIIEEMFNGQMRKMIVQVSRNGHVYALDRMNGDFLYAGEYTRVNWAERDERGKPVLKQELYEPADTMVFPGLYGGKNWPPASYSPDTHMLYIPTTEWGTRFIRRDGEGRPGTMDLGGIPQFDTTGTGWVVAFDMLSGEIAWQKEMPGNFNWAGTLSTGGGLVFSGAPDGHVYAMNDETGEVLWKFQTGSGIYAPPTSFTIDGKQYLGVASGTRNPVTRAGVATGIATGNYILFSL